METKPLLYGLIGFFAGGLIVSVAATMCDKPTTHSTHDSQAMTASLQVKTGDDFDKAFLKHMATHHQAAVDMAKLTDDNAKHDELKQFSERVIIGQQKELAALEQWQVKWYGDDDVAPDGRPAHNHTHH